MRMIYNRVTTAVFFSVSAMALTAVAQQNKTSQEPKSFEKEITIRVKFNYLLFLPEGYESSVKTHGLPKLLETKRDFPFVVVSPQSARGGWNPDALNALLDEALAKYKVDPDRVYLTGLSMGGAGSWELATSFPGRFAAVAPICGRGNPREAHRLKDLPIWAFHGAKDPTVPVAHSEEMVRAIKEAGGNPKLTIYPEARHDSWTETYNNPELYKWFLDHKR
jgi:predicted peptidase